MTTGKRVERTPEQCRDEFQRHLPIIRSAVDTNEATTRLRAIDTTLFDVLGWDKLDVDTETYCRAEGFADYACRDGTTFSLIIEAKRAGKTFVIPDVSFGNTPVGLTLIADECPEADAALRQAVGYAASLGARYVAITNGHQWLLTLTYIPNQALTERSVYIFESLDAIAARFRDFCNVFSPVAIRSNRPANALIESRKAPAPAKLSQRIPLYPEPATRNTLSNELSVVVGTVVGEVKHAEEDPVFLAKCYVPPEASASSMTQAVELIGQRQSTDNQIHNQAIDPNDLPDLLQHYVPEKPVVVLGKVGHGKSTFLQYLRKIKAKDALKKIHPDRSEFHRQARQP